MRGLVRTSAASPGSEDACEDERQGVHEGGDARERALRGRGRGRYACVNRALARAVNGDDDAVVATPIGPSQAYQRSPYHFAGGKDGITAIHLLEWC